MDYVNLDIKGDIAVLSINRPEAMNALNRQVVDEIDEAIEKINILHNIRTLVIYSKGNFAAGADIKAMVECSEKDAKNFAFSDTFNKIENLTFPTVALIEGYALGGGLELALACDIRLASFDAKMGFPEINLGIMPGAGGTVRTPRLAGEAVARELIFTGRIIDAMEAKDAGLINSVIVPDELESKGMALALKLASKAPCAMSTAKKTIAAGLAEPDKQKAIETEAENWASLFNTEDQREGMCAFIEKRKPVYTGRQK